MPDQVGHDETKIRFFRDKASAYHIPFGWRGRPWPREREGPITEIADQVGNDGETVGNEGETVGNEGETVGNDVMGGIAP